MRGSEPCEGPRVPAYASAFPRWIATEMRCLRKAVSRLSPVTANVRRPSSATKCRACSPHEPNVSNYIGWHISSLTVFKVVSLKNYSLIFDNFLKAYRGDVRNILTSFPGFCNVMTSSATASGACGRWMGLARQARNGRHSTSTGIVSGCFELTKQS